MWVTEERKDEYIAAGHKLAAKSCDISTTPAPETKSGKTRKKKGA